MCICGMSRASWVLEGNARPMRATRLGWRQSDDLGRRALAIPKSPQSGTKLWDPPSRCTKSRMLGVERTEWPNRRCWLLTSSPLSTTGISSGRAVHARVREGVGSECDAAAAAACDRTGDQFEEEEEEVPGCWGCVWVIDIESHPRPSNPNKQQQATGQQSIFDIFSVSYSPYYNYFYGLEWTFRGKVDKWDV